MKIQVLGTGCPKCAKLAENAGEAARELGVECEIEKVTSIDRILSFGVAATPALVVDGEVKVVGKAASVAEIRGMIEGGPAKCCEGGGGSSCCRAPEGGES